MKAVFLPPKENQCGNILWNKQDFSESSKEISESLAKLRNIGYWASPFPEGDGVTFSIQDKESEKAGNDIFNDFSIAFDWLELTWGTLGDSNLELAELEADREMKCIVIVPLEKVFIEQTIHLGPYSYFCKRQFDPKPYERLTNIEGEYLQFEVSFKYVDLLKLKKSFNHDNYVINKCLSLAEQALDIVRYVHSSFTRMEFTPNPAGQRDSGFFDVEIIPTEQTHLKPFEIGGISKSISVSNNWLGPELDHLYEEGVDYLVAIHNEDIENEMTHAVVGALRSCRQSFYSLGVESQFLNLVFTLDGLLDPDWKGWKHRTYVASLLSGGNLEKFNKTLKRYDELYHNVRNKLVHEGKDFYQLNEDPAEASEEFYNYIKDIVKLVSIKRFNNISEMKAYAVELLKRDEFKESYTTIINEVSAERGKAPQIPTW